MTECCWPQGIPGIESHTLACVLERPDRLEIVPSDPPPTASCPPSRTRAEVRRIRDERIDRFGHIDPPPGLEDAPREVQRDAIVAIRGLVADGELTREEHDADLRAMGALGDRETPALDGVFRHVD